MGEMNAQSRRGFLFEGVEVQKNKQEKKFCALGAKGERSSVLRNLLRLTKKNLGRAIKN